MPQKGKKSQAMKLRWKKIGESEQSTPAEQPVSSNPPSNRQVNVPDLCNSTTFLAFLHELRCPQSADLDLVLDKGHTMYQHAASQLKADGHYVHPFLNTEEIPEIVFDYKQHHVMTKCESVFGLFTAKGIS